MTPKTQRNNQTFDVQSTDETVVGRILDFIGNGEGDWKVVLIGKYQEDLIQLLERVQFTADSSLELARSGSCLRNRFGSVFCVGPGSALLEGLSADGILFVLDFQVLSKSVLEACICCHPTDVILWVPDR